jgi:hypothetical protein
MSVAEVPLHPELIGTSRAIALSALGAIEREGLRLAPLIQAGDIACGDAADMLIRTAEAYGLCRTRRERETVEHVIRVTLDGRPAGVGYVPPQSNSEITSPPPEFRPLTAAEFLELKLPPRRQIIAPWLREKGLAMIYSSRGIGKTLLGLTSGYAIAVGAGFLGFKIETPRKVVYVDGEMPAPTMQERLAAIVNGFPEQPPTPEHFRILISDLTENGLPDLATLDGQARIDAQMGDAEVIFVDNLSTLVRSGKENEAEAWLPIQSWALRHRRAGRAIVFFHHAGKGGAQRGTSRREDVLDTVISLRRPSNYSPDQGARFELYYEKSRGFYDEAAQPFEAKYEARNGAAVWTRTEIVDAELARVVAALYDGMTIREAADALGMHRSKVDRLRKKAIETGKLVPVSEAAE